MRYVYIALVVVFTGIVLLFMFQNLAAATVSLFTASITLPISVLVLLTYVLGMLTGGSVLALLRAGVKRAQSTPPR
jgi:putative membrane protein